MCGRMTLSAPPEEIIEKYKIQELRAQLKPRFNISPSQQIAAVTEEAEGRVLDGYRWGLIPSWADDAKIGYKMINAKCETVAEKPSYKKLLTSRRCIIPADGFYEWKGEKPNKTPFHIHMKDRSVFGIAGLWSPWRPKGSDDPWLHTCTVITTTNNELMAPIHDRMPVILDAEAAEAWLNPDLTEADQLLKYLRPYDSAAMEAVPVSRLLNNPKVDSPECMAPDSSGGEVIVNSA